MKRVKVKTYYDIVLPSLPLLTTPFIGSLSRLSDENRSFQCKFMASGLDKETTRCINSKSGTPIYSSSYIKQFWVGLMDGDGSITVDENKPSSYSRPRIFLSLNNTEKNRIMLNLIQKEMGGKVRIERKDKYVTWVIVSRKDIKTALLILNQYPLLTTTKKMSIRIYD